MLAKSNRRSGWEKADQSPPKLNKRRHINFEVKFNLKSDENLKTTTRVKIDETTQAQKKKKLVPLFEQSSVLFLSKPLKTNEKENKRKIISVDISNERKKRYLNSKTVDMGKKVFKRKIKKKLKLNIRKSIRTIHEIPTHDREAREIEVDSKK